MAKSKPWLEYGDPVVKEREPKSHKTKTEAYAWLVFGGLFLGCHRRYIGQKKQANRLLILYLLCCVGIVLAYVFVVDFYPEKSFEEVELIVNQLFAPIYLIYVREVFILPRLVLETNHRIDAYNRYWLASKTDKATVTDE